MKRTVLLILLLAATVPVASAQTASVTNCEWFSGTDPGVGLGNAISIGSPADSVSLSFAVATGAFPPGITRIKIRCRADSVRSNSSGVWGPVTESFAMVSPGNGTVRLVTQFDYRVDNRTWTSVDPADAAQININETVATAGLPFGLHKFDLRVYDDATRLGPVTESYFFVVTPTASQSRLITQFEFRVDNGSWTPVDPADSAQIPISQAISTSGLGFGLHRLDLRLTDDLNRLGPVTTGYFFVFDPATSQVRLVTQIEYWFNSNPPTTLDVTDVPTVDFDEILATAGLPIGLNSFKMRVTDDLGRIGPVTTGSLIVISPFGPGQPRTITAAEFYVNVDPGPGNGVPIPLPVDGVFDESQEDVVGVITGVPIGMHLVAVRVRDNAGRWSARQADSLLVGPILVVRSVGDDVILDWDSGPGVTQFKIYGGTTHGGAYAVIDSTAEQTYTDTGAVPGASRRFYYVTFEAGAFSTFRMPEVTPARE